MGVNYSRLLEMYTKLPSSEGPAGPICPEANSRLREQFTEKVLKPADFDLGRLFEACFGASEYLYAKAHPRDYNVNEMMTSRLREAGPGAVTTAAFANITGQIVYSATLEPYKMDDYTISRLIPEMDTQFLDGEKIAGITEIGDRVAIRDEGYPYEMAGVGENWIFAPAVKDRGVEVPVTWEAVFADRTGRLLDRCRDIGKWSGLNREKRAIDCLFDLNTTTHRYNWRGTVIQSYGANSGTHTWSNLNASNGLTDWTNLNTAEQSANVILDPFTGEPVDVIPMHLVTTKSIEHTAERVLRATEIDVATPGYSTTGNPTRTKVANPYLNRYQLVTNRYVYPRVVTAGGGNSTDWLLGNVSQYARYAVAERFNVQQMPPNSMEEYRRRIVSSFRVNERGAYFVWDPRYMQKSTA